MTVRANLLTLLLRSLFLEDISCRTATNLLGSGRGGAPLEQPPPPPASFTPPGIPTFSFVAAPVWPALPASEAGSPPNGYRCLGCNKNVERCESD